MLAHQQRYTMSVHVVCRLNISMTLLLLMSASMPVWFTGSGLNAERMPMYDNRRALVSGCGGTAKNRDVFAKARIINKTNVHAWDSMEEFFNLDRTVDLLACNGLRDLSCILAFFMTVVCFCCARFSVTTTLPSPLEYRCVC